LKFISYNSPAKINLFLYITGKRDDGFHELFSLVQQIDLMDIIQIKPSNHFELSVNGPEIHGENIIVKAKKALENYLKRAINLEVILSKRIPIGSGLGSR
jgi:4-diphosphocytidyl-2-C-methyl-D-erythritol kinase